MFSEGHRCLTSPSESEDDDELLDVDPLVDEDESLESLELSEEELLEEDDELELALTRFLLAATFFADRC